MRDPNFSLINYTISQSGQFHYGSITTKDFLSQHQRSLRGSQFHYGSITTTKIEKEKGYEFDSLNSTMVRLQRFMTEIL